VCVCVCLPEGLDMFIRLHQDTYMGIHGHIRMHMDTH